MSGSDSRKALVVDFDRRTLAETQALLERHGIVVTPAASIQDVRQTLKTTLPPVIIIEPVLAEADGFDLCRAIVKLRTTSPPAVFMVSRKVKGNTARHAASTVGALRFVELPNEASLLTELVDRAFSWAALRPCSSRPGPRRAEMEEIASASSAASPQTESTTGHEAIGTQERSAIASDDESELSLIDDDQFDEWLLEVFEPSAALMSCNPAPGAADEPTTVPSAHTGTAERAPSRAEVPQTSRSESRSIEPAERPRRRLYAIGLIAAVGIVAGVAGWLSMQQREPERAAPRQATRSLEASATLPGLSRPSPSAGMVVVDEKPDAATSEAPDIVLERPAGALEVAPPSDGRAEVKTDRDTSEQEAAASSPAPPVITQKPQERREAASPTPEPVTDLETLAEQQPETSPEDAAAPALVPEAVPVVADPIDAPPADDAASIQQPEPSAAITDPDSTDDAVGTPERPHDSVVRVATVTQPILESRIEPRYPAAAERMRAGGAVVLRAQVRSDGTVGDVEVVSGASRMGFGKAAAAAVKKWRYRPATSDGEPVEAEVTIAIQFSPR